MNIFKYIAAIIREGLGIIVIVAVVIVFSYFDPFGWFEPRARIDSTAIMVREVKQIGELITAEYYGEAITSWPATVVNNAFSGDSAEVYRIVFGIYNDFRRLDEERKSEDWNPNRRMRYYRNHIKEKYSTSLLYGQVMEKISEIQPATADMIKYKNDFWPHEEAAVAILYEQTPERIRGNIALKLNEIISRSRVTNKNLGNKDAACIGRGIVRAGFDFSKLNEGDVHHSETSKTIFITNATPRILSVELNPWFIPQRRVKGFEILKLEGKIGEDDIRKIKARCKEMIRQQAVDRKIVAEAKRNGEEALLSFFNLVSQSPVERVVVISDPLDEMRYLYDTLVTFSPAQALDVYNKGTQYLNDSLYYTPEPDSLKAFIRELTIHRKSQIDYTLAVSDSATQAIDRKTAPFTLEEVLKLRTGILSGDTLPMLRNAAVRKRYHSFWSR